MPAIRIIVLTLVLLSPSVVAEPLRSVSAVRALTPERAALKLPVEIEAQVLKSAPPYGGMFIHDGTDGIYLAHRKKAYVQGQVVRIVGVSHQGGFLPHIVARKIEVVGTRTLPEPLRPNKEELFHPTLDCRWIELQGVVQNVVVTGFVCSLRLECFGESIDLVLPNGENVENEARKLLNQAVTVRGVAATQSNARRQMTGRLIQVSSLDAIVAMSVDAADQPVTSIDHLSRLDSGSLETVKVRGVVTHTVGNLVYLQDSTGSLLARTTEVGMAEVDDEIEIIGTLKVEPFSPALLAIRLNKMGIGTAPSPIEIDLGQKPFPVSWNRAFVELNAELLDRRASGDFIILNCSAKGHLFEATIPGSNPGVLAVEAGSLVRLRGICSLRSSRAHTHTFAPDGISLILRSPADIEVLRSPPWWTQRKVVMALSLAAVVGCLSLAWVWMLRKRVADQTSIISNHVEREVVQRERQRLARELHDSLEQNLSGLALQLNTAERKTRLGQIDGLDNTIGLAQRMLSFCQKESRESIYDLRHPSGDEPLNRRADDLLCSEAETRGAQIDFHTEGTPQKLDALVDRHMTKIVREAAINAMRHGDASLVDVTYRYGVDMIDVSICDNGEGFDVDAAPPLGHFGLIGMRERAQRIGGTLKITSDSKSGTVISLAAPYHRPASKEASV